MIEYNIKNNNGFLRWNNWKEFIKNTLVFGDIKKTSFAIIAINFNNSSNIISLFKYLKNDKQNLSIDLVLIENSNNLEEKEKLLNYIYDNIIKNITILETLENIGSAGAYGLGLEYSFEQNYKNIFIFEDDILLLDNNIFSEMISQSSEKKLVYINGPINTGCQKSWLVQIGLYPVEFLKKVGIPNPTYFTRSEDLEWRERFDRIIKKEGYKEIVVNKNYFHPYLKKNNGQPWWIYFSIRNHLYTTFKWFKISNFKYLITIFLYIWYGITKLLIEKTSFIINSVILGIFDFITGNYSFENNKNKLLEFKTLNLKYPDGNNNFLDANIIGKLTKNYYLLSNMLLSNVDRNKISHSKKITDLFKNGVLIGGFFSPLYPIFMLSKNIISIDEYDLEKNGYFVSIIKTEKINYLKIFISLIFSIILFLIILPFLFLKGFYIYMIKFI